MNTAAKDMTLNSEALPEPVRRRGLDEAQWRTLSTSLFPGAKPQSIMMAVDYCKARDLDVLKKPCHIVPMEVKDATTGQYEWRDVIMPGIYEYRTTAHRTGKYLGHSMPDYGPMKEQLGATAPEWCSMIFRRQTEHGVAEFPVRVYFSEVVALKSGSANKRWKQAPIQMLTKCTEAAGLREAFPDELGGEMTVDEMEGKSIAEDPKRDIPGQSVRQGYTAAEFAEKLEKWRPLVTGGQNAEELIAMVESKVALSDEQKAAIRALTGDTK